MHRFARAVGTAALSLVGLGLVAVATEPDAARSVTALPASTPTSTSVTVAPTTTVGAPPTSTAAAAPHRTAVSRPPAHVATAPVTAVPPPPRPTGRAASCGWAWDAMRIDDGSHNEVTMLLDAPGQPSQAVTITIKPGASLTSTPPISRATTTDAGGQAAATFALSNDKRDWTLTASATFASGATCTTPAFTLEY